MSEKHRLPSRTFALGSSVPDGLSHMDASRWAIGLFFHQLSVLETEITEYASEAIRALDPVFMHVIMRDTNLNHKIRIVGFLIGKKMTYLGDWPSDKKFISNISLKRNWLAHGALEFKEISIELSMPSEDSLLSNNRKIITQQELIDLSCRMAGLALIFSRSAEEHYKMLEKMRENRTTKG